MKTIVKKEIKYHNVIADYFEKKPLFNSYSNSKIENEKQGELDAEGIIYHIKSYVHNTRKADEMLWQYTKAVAWEKLFLYLCDLNYFNVVWHNNIADCETYWRILQQNSKHTIVEGYRAVISNPQNYSSDLLLPISRLLSENGFPEEGLKIQEHIVYLTSAITPYHILSVANLSQSLCRMGKEDVAFDKVKTLNDNLMLKEDAAPLLYEMGRICYYKGKSEEALKYLREASLICRTGMMWSEDKELFGQILMYRALSHGALGEAGNAIRVAKQGVNKLRDSMNESLLAWALSVTGLLYKDGGDKINALNCWVEAINIYEIMYEHEKITTLNNLISNLTNEN